MSRISSAVAPLRAAIATAGTVAVLAAALVAVGPAGTAEAAAPSTGRFTPVTTARVFAGTVGTTPTQVQIGGRGGIASTATAVVVNVEVEKPTASGYVRVTPAGSDPSVATQEFSAGTTISNLATVKLSGGRLQVKLSAGSGKVYLDVSGYYSNTASASTYSPLANFRLFQKTVSTTPTGVQVAGVQTVPSTATAVVVNTEVESPTAAGYVRVTPYGSNPAVAVQEFAAGQTISNLVTVGLTNGKIQVKVSAGSAKVFMDVAGYYSPSSSGSVFVPIDTVRSSTSTLTTTPRRIPLAGTAGVPGTATAVVANAEIESPTSAGYLRITPYQAPATVAAQEFRSGQTISNLTLSKVAGASVQANVSAGTARLYLDVSGYFLSGSSGSGIGADVSWPQGTGPYPTNQAFGIVGVNRGLANNTNPNLAQQLAWAQSSAGGTSQPKASLYVNWANPGTVSTSWPTSNEGVAVPSQYGTCTGNTNSSACAYVYGYDRARDDATIRGVSSPGSYTWWIDVETDSSYNKSVKASNVADTEGMVAGFKANGVTSIGLYSTKPQWTTITGGLPSSALSKLPNWIAIGTATLASAQQACSGQPLMSGKIVMTQYISGSFDYDNACS